MKKHLLKSLLALALVLVCGNVWGANGKYVKVTSTNDLTDGQYLIVYETGGVALDGSLATIDAVGNTVPVTPANSEIAYSADIANAAFTFKASDGSLLGTNGKYIGHSGSSYTLNSSTTAYKHTFTFDDNGNVIINQIDNSYTLRYNKTSGQERFRYYTSGQQAIQLYKYVSDVPVGPIDPTITTTNMSCSVEEIFNVSLMFSSNSTGAITYSVVEANAEDYKLDGSKFLSEVAGTYTIKASQAAVDGKFKAGEATATLTVLGKYTVNYYSLGTNIGTEEVVDGQSIANAPDVTNAPEGWSFYGWTEDGQYSFSTTAPVLFDGVVTSNVSLYAVYAKTEVIGKSEYRRVTADQSDWRGDYLIAYSKTVFMDGSLSGGDTGVGKAQAHVSPGKACSTDGMTVTAAWGDKHYVTIEAIDDADLSKGYVIKSHNTITPYFYHSSNSNGMSGTGNKTTAAKYPISVIFNSASDIDIALGGEATGAILHYDNNVGSKGEMFRFYKDGGQENVYLYKKNDGTCTTYALIPDYTVAISSVGFATAYMGFDATVTGANAYYVTVSDDVASLTKVEGVIPANTGVVLEAQNGGATTATFTESAATAEDKAAAEGNMLVGTTVGKTFHDEGYTYYILSKGTGEKADVVDFYWDKDSNNGEKAKCGANKAVLAVPAKGGAAASSISIRFDGATMIESIVETKNDVYFDLQGRKVENPTNGLYIVNGKKMLVK